MFDCSKRDNKLFHKVPPVIAIPLRAGKSSFLIFRSSFFYFPASAITVIRAKNRFFRALCESGVHCMPQHCTARCSTSLLTICTLLALAFLCSLTFWSEIFLIFHHVGSEQVPQARCFQLFVLKIMLVFYSFVYILIIKTNTENLRSKFPPEAGKKERKKKIRATEQAPRAGREELF